MSSYNLFLVLLAQLDVLAKHNRQGSFQTKSRYYEAMKRFCLYLAMVWHLQKLSNIAPVHVSSYVVFMQENGYAPATIKTELSAIRFFHDKVDNPRYRIPDNNELDLERRHFGGVDRTWSDEEFDRMIAKAVAAGRDDVACALCIGRYCGLRIHEVERMDTAIAEQALRADAITIKGKGGKIRTVPIEDECVRVGLRGVLKQTKRGHKLFVPDEMATDEAIYRLQLFIIRHRDEVQSENRESNLTFHGLRHTYAVEKYKSLLEMGMSEINAHLTVSRLLGHERPDVTDIYLASLKKEEAHDED